MIIVTKIQHVFGNLQNLCALLILVLFIHRLKQHVILNHHAFGVGLIVLKTHAKFIPLRTHVKLRKNANGSQTHAQPMFAQFTQLQRNVI